tara:strand:- start:243 stop:455 length:213 start_codon:yes stop_codon:yes gene_type:complete
VKHLINTKKLDKDADSVKVLQMLARKGHPELITVFQASYDGAYFNADTFDEDFFIENATAIVEEYSNSLK